MKRLICVLASLVLVATVVEVRPAKAAYFSTFTQSTPYTFEVQTATKVAVTFLLVTSKGRLDVEEILVFDDTNTTAQVRTIPRNVNRVIIKLDSPLNGSGIVKLTQGTSKFELRVEGHEEAVFDVIP